MRLIAVLLAVLVLALSVAACGSSRAGGAPSSGHRVISGVFCAITVYHLYRDVKAHRLGWAAFEALLAHHNCKQAFRRP